MIKKDKNANVQLYTSPCSFPAGDLGAMFIEGNIATVISGSYRRHLQQMYVLKRFLEAKGITVLSPVGLDAINPGQEFVLLDADPIHDHRTLQDSVFAKIRRSSFLVSFNRDGYVGKASLLEYGYAIAVGIPILTLEPAEDPNILPYTRLLADVIGSVEA
jgi:hypothetical protein